MGHVISKEENLLSEELLVVGAKKKKVRNYSFRNSKRLPVDRMTEVNGVKIPSMPGSCYHAIISALAENKGQFCGWDKIIDLTRRNMRMYGGSVAWDKFVSKSNVKSYEQRIKDNAHTLTRRGRDCYGYRLHELGMCIYYFKDGAVLFVGGRFVEKDDGYDVVFEDKRALQIRYRGTTMTHKEYKDFLNKKYINISGRTLNHEGIKNARSQGITLGESIEGQLHVCVALGGGFDQHTANRLEAIGLNVEQALGNELLGTINGSKLDLLRSDCDVAEVEVSGE